MSLATRLADLTTRIATEVKTVKTLIAGNNAGDLSGLTTTDKSSLLAAVNEVADAVAGSSGIDDGTTGTTTTWSSSKITSYVGDEIAAIDIPDPADLIDDTAASTSTVYSSTKTDSQIAAAVDAIDVPDPGDLIDDTTASTTSVYSSSKTDSQISAQVSALVNSAPGTLDTLKELADALGDDANFSTTVNTALGNRVRVDTAAQGLTTTQQGNARTNIAAASAAAVGDTEQDLVGIFETGLS